VIYLDVCCNDPDNGAFAGRAVNLQIGDAEFEANNFMGGSTFKEVSGGIILSGKRWEIEWSKDWVGNWAWNRYLLAKGKITARWYMVEFVTWLRKRDLFHCGSAPVEFYDWFNGDTEISPADLHTIICNLEPRRETAA
jgi:hypothetical protein